MTQLLVALTAPPPHQRSSRETEGLAEELWPLVVALVSGLVNSRPLRPLHRSTDTTGSFSGTLWTWKKPGSGWWVVANTGPRSFSTQDSGVVALR